LVHSFASVSRIRRTNNKLSGYQRPEVLSHIAEIRAFLDGPDPMLPNAVVLAFTSVVKFEPAEAEFNPLSQSRRGTLSIPLAEGADEHNKPGLIVDGQQRLAAIRDAKRQRFPVCITAFITDDLAEQTEQFILVNSTKPLPKTLIYELLPHTKASLPTTLRKKRFPAYLAEQLNFHESSPLRNMIRTQTTPEGIVKDNSILRMLENSLAEGLLFRYRARDESGGDFTKMLKALFAFWGAVKAVFPEAWGQPPKKSRLLHGAGVLGLGFLMDAIADRYRGHDVPSRELFSSDLAPIRDVCRWTDGYWDFGGGRTRKWNEIQNTSRDIELLANHLLMHYKNRVWHRQ
jgi:DGQHR domain-containing protein